MLLKSNDILQATKYSVGNIVILIQNIKALEGNYDKQGLVEDDRNNYSQISRI